jgi:B12-binding domain/radical SAM domain protein
MHRQYPVSKAYSSRWSLFKRYYQPGKGKRRKNQVDTISPTIQTLKRRIIFRVSPQNCLSFPVLLNAWEKNGIDKEFEIVIREVPLETGEIRSGDVILFSFMTSLIPYIHNEILQIKKAGQKDIVIAGGGPHITGEQELARQVGIDILFIGAGERSFVQFGMDLTANRSLPLEYIQPSGSVYGDDFRNHIPVSRYIRTIPPLEIMRGCRWHCKYCSTPLYEVQYRDMDSIDACFREMKQRRMNRINFISPSSMEYGSSKGREVNVEAIEELLVRSHSYGFRFIEYGIFPSEVRPDTVTTEGMKLLKKYVTNKYITIGAQSGVDERLRELRRGHTVEDIEKAIVEARDNGLFSQLDFIIGYPGETPEERRITVEFIKKLNKKYRVRSHLHYFIPLSGSPYAFRLPTFLSADEKETLYRLRRGGTVIDGWVENEKQVLFYLEWLKENFPGYYSRYI